jgi:hypothetical protein
MKTSSRNPHHLTPYPTDIKIDYPDRKLNRLTSFLRIFTVLPAAIVLFLIIGVDLPGDAIAGWAVTYIAGSVLFLPLVLTILFRQKYPRWWFNWNYALVSFSLRVAAYLELARDEYPALEEEQAVHLTLHYPDVKNQLNRWFPLIKWLLVFPHYLVLIIPSFATEIVVIIAWFSILINGRYPRRLFNFVSGVDCWFIRVLAYAFLLTTDRYPPFSFQVWRE